MDILKEEAVKEAGFLQEGPRRAESSGFWRHFNAAAFLQESSLSADRKHMSDALLQVGQKHDLRLVTLALRVKIDNFPQVKKAIENMTMALEKEQKDEVKQRDFCADSLATNKDDIKEKNTTKQKQTAEEMELEAEIKATTDEAAALQSEVDELLTQMKLASQNREKENGEFQSLILEQREKRTALQKALAVLKDIYAVKAASLVQTQGAEEPASFGAYEQSAGGTGVLATIQQVIEDTEAMSGEAAKADSDAQQSYQAFAAETDEAIKLKRQGIEKQNEKQAKQEMLLAETSDSKRMTSSEIGQLLETKEQLHESCDFLLAQFEVRQKARSEELAALDKAKSILSGALVDK